MNLKKYREGQWVRIEADLELGPALIVNDANGNTVDIRFSRSGEIRTYTLKNPPFRRIEWVVGQKVRCDNNSKEFEEILSVRMFNELYYVRTQSGEYCENQIQDWEKTDSLEEVILQKKWTHPRHFLVRAECELIKQEVQVNPNRGLAGPRVELLPHQLWVADQVTKKSDSVRAVLCDEVGLGKTIEAGLVLSSLSAQQKIKKVLVLVPQALKIQWLTELYNKFQIKFRLEHEDILDDQDYRDYVISSIEDIERNDSDIDLLIVDEAHRLASNSSTKESLEKWVKQSKRVLFLTATPASLGDMAFKEMIQMLVSENQQKPLLFHSRRADIGMKTFRTLEAAYCQNKLEWIDSFIGEWVSRKKKDKLFLICQKASQAKSLAQSLQKKWGTHFALFHEEMDLVERDRQAAYFSESNGARVLISSEIGGEGRNFQFCHDILLADLPGDPLKIEQRIGRLDRIGQTEKVRVWCPIEESEEELFEMLRDEFKVFEQPWTGRGIEDDGRSLAELVGSDRKKELHYETLSVVEYKKYDSSKAAELHQQVSLYSQYKVLPLLEKIFESFGVEVEDFDTLGNIKASASSLMFVESFPGLGPDGERVFTEDRKLATVRNELAFINIDSPEFWEILHFFLNSDLGRVVFAQSQQINSSLVALVGAESVLIYENQKPLSVQSWLKQNTVENLLASAKNHYAGYENQLMPVLAHLRARYPKSKIEGILINTNSKD